MNIYLIVAIGLVLIALPIGVIAYVLLSKQEEPPPVEVDTFDYRGALDTLLKTTAEIVNRNQARLEKMRPFIASYFNTLYKDNSSASEVKIANQIIFILERRIEKANNVLRRGSVDKIKAVTEGFKAPIVVKLVNELKNMSDEPSAPDEPKEYVVEFDELEGAMENLVQSIGQRIANASENMSSYRGEGGSRKRKGTMTTLKEIGIKV